MRSRNNPDFSANHAAFTNHRLCRAFFLIRISLRMTQSSHLPLPGTDTTAQARCSTPGRAFAFPIVVLFASFAQLGLAQGSPDQILQALRAKDYPAAVSAADAVLATHPTHPEDCRILVMRGMALRGEGRAGDGLQSFQAALDACPHFVPALEGAAQIEYARRSPGAKALLEELIAIQPENPTAHAMLAVLAWQRGDCASALPHFEMASSLVQQNPEAKREYAACLLAAGDAVHSVDLYR
jgi:cytochrome c-type biogenesis protein CcmH/NrfG